MFSLDCVKRQVSIYPYCSQINQMKTQLKNLVSKHVHLNEYEFDTFYSIFKPIDITPKTILVKEGAIAKKAYFIIKGSIRFFYLSNGIEVTGNIFTENMFSTSHDSFLLQIPSKYTLETIENVRALVFTFKEMQGLILKVPKVQELISKILIYRLTLAHRTIARLITLSPEERYLIILKENPEWFQRIPHYIIASYIGISPTSLSRIRKRIT